MTYRPTIDVTGRDGPRLWIVDRSSPTSAPHQGLVIRPATLRVALAVLIGGPASGKSTVGGLVADRTSRALIDADEHGTPWYAEVVVS